MASCSTRKWQIKSGLSSDTPWETSSICMIYLLRQMKSLSAYSCEKVSMSPPREQMQFVSNLILSKLLFFFFSMPQWPMGTALKGELVVCLQKNGQLLPFSDCSKRATSHSLSSQLTPLEKAKGKDEKIFVVLKLKVKVITCGINDSSYFQKLHVCFHFCFTQQKIRSLSLCQRLLIH